MEELSIRESVERDLSKCREKLGYRPMWVIAEDSNKREKVATVKRVKFLPVFMGCQL